MKKTITSAEDLGLLIRAVRKSTNAHQDDLSATAGVGRQFAITLTNSRPPGSRILGNRSRGRAAARL
jgi:DNA-binding XRE family transcriptional regulator